MLTPQVDEVKATTGVDIKTVTADAGYAYAILHVILNICSCRVREQMSVAFPGSGKRAREAASHSLPRSFHQLELARAP